MGFPLPTPYRAGSVGLSIPLMGFMISGLDVDIDAVTLSIPLMGFPLYTLAWLAECWAFNSPDGILMSVLTDLLPALLPFNSPDGIRGV